MTGERTKLRPIGLHWGGQSFVAGDDRRATQYGPRRSGFAPDLNAAIDQLPSKQLPAIDTGKDAAKTIVKLVARSIKAIPPRRIIEVYESNGHRVEPLWNHHARLHLAKRVAGLAETQLRGVSRPRLAELYLDRSWVPSVYLTEMSVENGELVIGTQWRRPRTRRPASLRPSRRPGTRPRGARRSW